MQKMANDRLVFSFKHNTFLRDSQSGFKIHQSKNQQIIRLSEAIKDTLDRSETLVADSVDFEADGIVFRETS